MDLVRMAGVGPQHDGSARARSAIWSSEQRTEYWTPASILNSAPMRSGRNSLSQQFDLMVARDRIELPTRGFSVLVNLHPVAPKST